VSSAYPFKKSTVARFVEAVKVAGIALERETMRPMASIVRGIDASLSKDRCVRVTLLIPTSLPDRCYLIEALMWVALNRFPVSSRITPGTSWDDREEERCIQGAAPFLPYDSTVTDDECSRVGLPPNPAYTALKESRVYYEPNDLRALLAHGGLPDRTRSWFEHRLPETIAYHERKAAWDMRFEEYLADPKAKLLRALHEGAVDAFGIKIGTGVLGQFTYLQALRWPNRPWPADVDPDIAQTLTPFRDIPPWEPIPPEMWTPEAVRWEGCWAENAETAYCLILVETESCSNSFLHLHQNRSRER
jgi:hypothetical protein